MMILLKDIVNISSGYHFVSKIENYEKSNLQLIQLKDISEYNKIDYLNLTKCNVDNIKQTQLLEKGNVLIKCRGFNFTASYIERDVQNIIATSNFFILKIIDSIITPEYLTWFINDEDTQKKIKAGISGTNMLILSKSFIENLEIKIPNLEIQRKIVEVKRLSDLEAQITLQRVELKKNVIDNKLRKLINKG